MDYLKLKLNIENEYNLNIKNYLDEFEEVASMNEKLNSNDPYASRSNIDNYPTHRYKDPTTNQEQEYCAASKHFRQVDPKIEDRRTIHYAGEDRTYLILKNKFTKEWEFPTTQITFGQTFIRAK